MTEAIVKATPNEATLFAGARDFETAQRMAKALANSSLIPKDYQGNLSNVLVAMEIAARVGTGVVATMQNLDVIHGKPAWRASALIAMVNASGKFTPLRFHFEGKPSTKTHGCWARAKSLIDGELCDGELITMEMADSEGWTKRNGSKWRTMPGQMLRYRAAAFWARIYCPELALGFRTDDEAHDMAPPVEVPATILPGDTKQLEASLVEAPADDPPEPVETSIPDDELQQGLEL